MLYYESKFCAAFDKNKSFVNSFILEKKKKMTKKKNKKDDRLRELNSWKKKKF